ncbi:MAG: T9SS type A sorting domain-containing protein [bacterium]|nr:MAG: T9SS type A sorting domain-containing protein [bacterium]
MNIRKIEHMLQNLHYLFLIIFLGLSEFTFPQQWQYKSPMPSARRSMAVTVFDDRIWVMGGNVSNFMGSSTAKTVQVYDPTTDSWDTNFADLQFPRTEGVARTMGNKIYLFGGLNSNGLVEAVEQYDPAYGNWQTISQLPTPRRGITSVIVDSTIWLIGGSNLQNNFYDIIEIYDPLLNDWDTLDVALITARSDAMSTATTWGIFVFGGNLFGPLDDIEYYNPSTQQWTHHGQTLYHCFSAGYTSIGDSSCWIIGGMGLSGIHSVILDRVQVYYWKNQQFYWEEGPSLNTARRDLAAATVNHKIYAIGGRGSMGHNLYDVVEELVIITDIKPVPCSIPTDKAILGNYPNPFNSSTTIEFQLPEPQYIYLELLNILGQKIKTLYEGHISPGRQQLHLSSADFSGIEQSSGVYFIQLKARKYLLTHKIFLLK